MAAQIMPPRTAQKRRREKPVYDFAIAPVAHRVWSHPNHELASTYARWQNALTNRASSPESTGNLAPPDAAGESVAPSYDSRVASEQRFFTEPGAASELPEIYQYWSNNFLRPRLARAGFDGPLDMFRRLLSEAYVNSARIERRFLSIGSGNCLTEIALAEHLLQRGQPDFVFECFELNPVLVAQGNTYARDRGVSRQIAIVETDVNSWSPSFEYDAVLANSSLHHIQNLEHVFAGIAQCLASSGTFLTSDTIGRNGHMRWPEALEIVEEYWRELPLEYRFNQQLQRHEHEFVNWDCSSEGFEGIRAQDILPLLIERFDFDFFGAFANIIDPFIDRSFGHNFNSSRFWDRAFIGRVEARDTAEIHNGRIKPTHLVAAMCVDRPGRNVFMDGLTPRFCVREPSRPPRPVPGAEPSTVEIADRTGGAVAPMANFSDLWWNPKESGWGVSIHQQPNGQLVAVWLGFDEQGNPTWLTLQPGKWITASTFEGPVFRHTGSSALKPYDASELVTEVAGTGALVFENASTGRLTFELGSMRIVKDIERMKF